MRSPFRKMSIKVRMALGFAATLALMVALTVIGVLRVNGIDARLDAISDVHGVKQRHAINLRGSVHDRAIALRDVALLTTPDEVNAAVGDITRLANDYARSAEPLAEILAAGGVGAEERELYAGIQAVEARTLPLVQRVIELRRAGNDAAAREVLLAQARPAFVDWLNAINRFIDLQEAVTRAEAQAASDAAHGFEAVMLALCGAALLTGVVVATALTRGLMNALGAEPAEVKALAEAVNRGELFHEVRLRRGDRASIMATLARMAGTLRSTVTGVREAAEGVAHTSDRIAHGNADLSGRTDQQASALQQTAASMEQLGGTVQRNAASARHADRLAAGARDVAVRGGTVVEEVVSTMRGINDSSRRIGDIIGVIDAIAFQTNILALNAAVEAARAGEHGRGFSVVASEVRSLAQRSASAAHEIKDLITASVEQVERGSVLVDQAGTTMQEIVRAIRQVTDLMGEISAASAEQNTGVAEVAQAVTKMDGATQQNATLVEENAAVAANLRQQAQQLLQSMSVFRLAQA